MKNPAKGQNTSQILRITLFAGLILFVLSGLSLTVFYLIEKNSSKTTRDHDNFIRILREYDTKAAEFFGTEREYDHLNGELDRLEKRAISVESWLSILKRRRSLALMHQQSLHSSSLSAYQTSVNNALKAYPSSQPIIAVACSALVKDSGINKENELRLREWMSLMTDRSLNNLNLNLHILLGDFNNIKAADLNIKAVESDGTQSISVNLALLKTFRGDIRGASSDIQMMLNTENISDNTLQFAAEYHYDFGDILRSAEIFSQLNERDATDNALIRQADALYLAGFYDSAISIWKILTQSNDSRRQGMQNENALYNLAVIEQEEQNDSEAFKLLKKLNDIPFEYINNKGSASSSISASSYSTMRQFALVRYSRFLDTNSAYSALRNNKNLSPERYPYIDLEICKRMSGEWNLGRRIAETWLVLDRHSEIDDLYQWAAWHFFFQRNYDEIPVFLDRLNLLKINTPWADSYKAIYLLNNGYLEQAEDILLSITAQKNEGIDPSVYVNLGRIYEELRSPSRALTQYEAAVNIAQTGSLNGNKTASKIYQRIARCLTALNRPNDAIRALLDALDLDPENMNARLELDRLIY